MGMGKSRVFAVVDESGRVIQIEGEYSMSNIADLETAVLVEQGTSCDRLNHAQHMYLDGTLLPEDGIPRYKWDKEQVIARTDDEVAADRAAITPPPPTAQEQLRADVDFLAAMQGVTL